MKRKYKRITFKILFCIPVLFLLYVIDYTLLPITTTHDKIISNRELHIAKGSNFNIGSSHFANHIKTQNGDQLVIHKQYIEEKEITIDKTFLFKIIKNIESPKVNYTSSASLGFYSANFFFLSLLTISAIISLFLIKYYRKLTEKDFQHILLVNSLIILYAIYVCALVR